MWLNYAGGVPANRSTGQHSGVCFLLFLHFCEFAEGIDI